MAIKTIPVDPVDHEFNVYCGDCGQLLDADFNKKGNLEVDPCRTCMEKASENDR
jgi:hypothetical protein